MFYFTLFIKNVLQNSWRTTAPTNSAPKMNFSARIKGSLYGVGKQILSNTILCKNLPQLISFNAAYLFLPFLGIILECSLKSHSYKKSNRKYTQSCSQNYAIKLFLKKASDQVCFGGIDRFCKYFFFLHSTSFAIGENSPEIVFKKLHFIFFR